MKLVRHRRRDPIRTRRVLLALWEDVLRVREPTRGRDRKVYGHNIYYRTEGNPRGASLAHHRTILPDKQNIEAAYVLADALMEQGGRLASLGKNLVWFMNVFEDWYTGERGIPAHAVLEPSEWLDFGFLIGDLTRELTGFRE